MRKNMDNTKIKNLKPFKNLFSSYYEHFLKSFFQWMSQFLSNKLCRKIFLMVSLIRNAQNVNNGHLLFPNSHIQSFKQSYLLSQKRFSIIFREPYHLKTYGQKFLKHLKTFKTVPGINIFCEEILVGDEFIQFFLAVLPPLLSIFSALLEDSAKVSF